MWMKQKGDTFYNKTNYESATHAYSEALKSDRQYVACYANRAACYLHMKQFGLCIEDCNVVINWNEPALSPSQERSNVMLVKAYARRGAAFAYSGNFQQGNQA